MTGSEADFVGSPEFQRGRKWEDSLRLSIRELGFTVLRNYQLPDLLVTDGERSLWVECKDKTVMREHPATGFDRHHYDRYLALERLLGRPVVVAFNDKAQGRVYGNTLKRLGRHIYRDNWAIKSGVIIAFDYDAAFLELGTPSNWRWLIEAILEGRLE